MPTQTNVPKKAIAKNYANFENFCLSAFFRDFELLTFLRSIFESRHHRIWNQHKILRFLKNILLISVILRWIAIEIPEK